MVKNRSEQTLKDIQKVNLRVDTFINEVLHHISVTKEKTKQSTAEKNASNKYP